MRRKGNSTEVKSSSAASTTDPDGSPAATRPTNWEVWLPVATSSGDRPIIAANAARPRSTYASTDTASTSPAARASSKARMASTLRRGASPSVAELRKAPAGANSSGARLTSGAM